MPYTFSNNDLMHIYDELELIYAALGGETPPWSDILAVLEEIDSKVATAAKQDTGNASLATIAGKDFATQTTLAAILAKIIAAPATEAKQDTGNASLATIAGKDFATQTTLAAILAKIIAAPATEAKQDTGNASLATIAGKDFATQTTLAAILAKIIAAPATEAKQDTGNASLSNIDGKLYAPKGNEVTGYSDSITDNTAHDVIAAQGANNYTYISAILVTNSHATVGTIVHIIDDTSAVLFSGYAAPINGGFTVSFPTPLRTSATNKKVQAICLTTGGNVTVSVTGFKGT